MNEAIQRILKIVKSDPAVQNAISFTGGGGASNTANMFVSLKPLEERKISASDVINRLRPKLNKETGASAFLQAQQDLRIGGRGSNALYQYTIQADTLTDLATWGPKLLGEMTHLEGFQNATSHHHNRRLAQ